MVAINELVALVADIAGIEVKLQHDLSAPQRVRRHNSDKTMILERLGWQPRISLHQGMQETYAWIADEIEVSAQCMSL